MLYRINLKNSTSDKIEAIKHLMKNVFAVQNELRILAPEFRWAGLGNLLGDYGECVAIDAYNLKKSSTGSDGYDAITREGKTVQIKTNHASSGIGFRGDADLLLVIHVKDDGSWNEIYYGDFSRVKNQCSFSSRDNKYVITITKLQKLTKS